MTATPFVTEDFVRQLARGILDYQHRLIGDEPFSLPYPNNLQRALDTLTLHAWRSGTEPPESVVDLLCWARSPLWRWPTPLTTDLLGPEETLLRQAQPTVACEELGILRGDVEGELRENRLIRAVLDKARLANSPEAYVAFRRLLIEQPVISLLDLDLKRNQAPLLIVADEVADAYGEVPAEAVANGLARTCGGCAGLLMPVNAGSAWNCLDEGCPRPGTPGRNYEVAAGVRWLRRELRTFIAAPGRAELRIAKAVETLGVPVRLWPDFDAADLAAFNEQPIVADVKAWRNPLRLAGRLKERAFQPPADAHKAFIVIAREQTRGFPEYIRVLSDACPELRPGHHVVAVTEKEFLSFIKKEEEARQ